MWSCPPAPDAVMPKSIRFPAPFGVFFAVWLNAPWSQLRHLRLYRDVWGTSERFVRSRSLAGVSACFIWAAPVSRDCKACQNKAFLFDRQIILAEHADVGTDHHARGAHPATSDVRSRWLHEHVLDRMNNAMWKRLRSRGPLRGPTDYR